MSENLRTFTKALYTLRAVADRVPADAWDNQSCCTEWTARQVAGHACWVIQAIGANAAEVDGPPQQPEADVAGDDPAATVRRSIDTTLAAFDHPGVLHRVTTTPFGEMPIDDFIGGIWIDPLAHAWDIADATGIDPGIDDETADKAHRLLETIGPMLRGAGALADPVDGGPDPVSRFARSAGRSSVRA